MTKIQVGLELFECKDQKSPPLLSVSLDLFFVFVFVVPVFFFLEIRVTRTQQHCCYELGGNKVRSVALS